MTADDKSCIGCGRRGPPGSFRKVEGLPVCPDCFRLPPPSLLDPGFCQRPGFEREPNVSGVLMLLAGVLLLPALALLQEHVRSGRVGDLSRPAVVTSAVMDVALMCAAVALVLAAGVLSVRRRGWALAAGLGLSGLGALCAAVLIELDYPGGGATGIVFLLDIPALAIILMALATTSRRDFLGSGLRKGRSSRPGDLPEGFRTLRGYVGSRRACEAAAVLSLASLAVILLAFAASIVDPGYWSGAPYSSQTVSPVSFWAHVLLLVSGAVIMAVAALSALGQRHWRLVSRTSLPALVLVGAALMRTPGMPSFNDHSLVDLPEMIVALVGFFVLVPCAIALSSLPPVLEPGGQRMPVLARISLNTMLCAGMMCALHAVSCVSVFYYHLEDLARGPNIGYRPVVDAVSMHLQIALSFTLVAFLVALALWRRGPANLVLAASTSVPAVGWLSFYSYGGEGIAYLSLYNFLAWGLAVAALIAGAAERVMARRALFGGPGAVPPPGVPYPPPVERAWSTVRGR